MHGYAYRQAISNINFYGRLESGMRGVDGDEDCHRSHALRGNAARTWERGRPRPHAGETPAIPDDPENRS